ncbi:MAG: lipid kinase, partial [Actinomycetota bacterium]|nr:lipid kinase [Actinomycetota bacterium]
MPTIALLANTESGSGDAAEVAAVLRELGAEVREFGLDQVEDAIASGPERIAVAGGDGSLGPVAAAVGAVGAPALAVIPTGTANDFARALGIPGDMREAC